MTEYLAQSPPLSPAGSEPDSPRCSLSSCNELSRYSRQISDPESSSSETESDQSDVFTENEVTTYTYTRMFLPFLLLTKSGEIFQHFSFCSSFAKESLYYSGVHSLVSNYQSIKIMAVFVGWN